MDPGIEKMLLNHSRGIGTGVAENEGVFTDQEIPRFEDKLDRLQYLRENRKELAKRQKELEEEHARIKSEHFKAWQDRREKEKLLQEKKDAQDKKESETD